MLQNLSEEIRECLRHAEECKRLSKTALTAFAISDYLEMEQRWLALARSYEFAERLSSFMGGDVTVTSEPGKGSVFTVRLPGSTEPRPQLGTPATHGRADQVIN